MDIKQLPIPAFYCCYLLRSSVAKASCYVGSTPNPKRRLKQHNGQSQGGAVRTNKTNLQPWEIACLVTGFQSRLAALQFEWAWQNAWKSLHLAENVRETLWRKGTRKPKRPNLDEKLKSLHLMLQAPGFSRWPLTLHFLIEEVYKKWCASDEKIATQIPKDIGISLDFNAIDEFANIDDLPPSGQPLVSLNARLVDRLDITYQSSKVHLVKSEDLLSKDAQTDCAVCHTALHAPQDMVLVCPHPTCEATSHVSCLAKKFLGGDASADFLVPISGGCPSCKRRTAWSDLVKEMSLRHRGSKERAALMKKPRKRKLQAQVEAGAGGGIPVPLASDSEHELEPDDEPLDDGWQPFDCDDDMMSVGTAVSELSDAGTDSDRIPPPKPRLEIVIEDSEDDDPPM